ncbi:MFS transporter [Dactylosporangium sp. NPDC051484]|uniref:MFS transporter n=1 Tax=Dactylosporangium sp. NPDC051484 TaxID=3154942 RepID=UPI003450A374
MDEPRWSDVYLTASARGISVCGDLLAATSLAVVLQQRGAGGYAVAALLLSASLPPVLLARPSGWVADRFDSRRIVSVVAPSQALCCLAMLTTSAPVALIALNALLACGVAVTQPVFAALAPAMVGVENVPRASAISQTFTSAGMFAGPVLAGALVSVSGLWLPLLLDAASFLAIAVVGLVIRTRRTPRPAVPSTPDGPPVVAYRVRDDRVLVVALGMVAVVVAAANLMDVAVVFFVRGTLHASAAMYGVVMGSWMLGLVCGSWAAARGRTDDHGYLIRLIVGLTLVSVGILAGGTVREAGWVIPAFVLGGMGNGMLGSAAGTLVARRTPQSARGMGFATLGAVINGAMVAGFVVAGGLLEVVSPRLVMIGSGASALALVIASGLPVLAMSRRQRRAADDPRTPVGAAGGNA